MINRATPQQIQEFLHLFDGDANAATKAISEHTRRLGTHTLPERATRPVSNDVLISVQSLTKSYKINKQHVNALQGITLDVHKGEFIALTGASGSGKSTLLQLMGGLDNPTSGEIVIDGVNINKLSDTARSTFRNKTIGFIFQFFYLQPFLQITKNIEVPGMFANTPREERAARVSALLDRVGLTEQEAHLPKQLSGGQTQRTAIARALLNNPKILLADEPTGNLDSTNSKIIIDLFKQIRDEFGTTIVIVTHNPEIAEQADREIRLQDGAII